MSCWTTRVKDHKSVSDDGFKYWLELIDVFGGHSPVSDLPKRKRWSQQGNRYRRYQGKYDNVKERYAGNLEHPRCRRRCAMELSFSPVISAISARNCPPDGSGAVRNRGARGGGAVHFAAGIFRDLRAAHGVRPNQSPPFKPLPARSWRVPAFPRRSPALPHGHPAK